jgi:hypothetical protein
MPGMSGAGNPTPPVKGYAKGQEIQFIHTEASDPQVAAMLTRMMGPQVLVVPSLKEIPDRLLATVFIFRNRTLRSAEEIRLAVQQGTLGLSTPGIVVNMPMLTWPGGHR